MCSTSFRPGFRLSFFDVLVLVLGTFGAAWLWQKSWLLSFVVACVVGHFFLFCNVFRIARNLEFLWAGVFVIATLLTLKSSDPSWIKIAVPSLVTAAIVIGLELRKPSYHGVGWSRINPGLREWWKVNHRR